MDLSVPPTPTEIAPQPEPPQNGASSRSNRWCFTVNNPELWRPQWTPSSMNYLVWEMERGAAGTPHIQGYCRFKSRLRRNQVLVFFPRAHLSLSRGSEEQNRNYCSKARQGTDWGEEGSYEPAQRQGQRTDLEAAITTLRSDGLRALKDNHPETYVKYHSGFDKLALHLQTLPPLRRPMETSILWGPPGIGKTWQVLDSYPDAFFVKPGRDPWGQYNNEETVVFDEYHPDKWDIQEMNGYLDIYRCRLNCRYVDKHAFWNRVIIISNIPPTSWYYNWPEDIRQAFFRRINNIYHMQERTEIFYTQPI